MVGKSLEIYDNRSLVFFLVCLFVCLFFYLSDNNFK